MCRLAEAQHHQQVITVWTSRVQESCPSEQQLTDHIRESSINNPLIWSPVTIQQYLSSPWIWAVTVQLAPFLYIRLPTTMTASHHNLDFIYITLHNFFKF